MSENLNYILCLKYLHHIANMYFVYSCLFNKTNFVCTCSLIAYLFFIANGNVKAKGVSGRLSTLLRHWQTDTRGVRSKLSYSVISE